MNHAGKSRFQYSYFRFLKLCLICVAFLGVAAGAFEVRAASVSTRPERRLIKKGNDFYGQSKFPEAIMAYKSALKENPESAVASFNLGLSQIQYAMKLQDSDTLKQQLLQSGVQLQQSVAQLGSSNAKLASMANYNLGNLQFEQENYTQAIALYKQALRLNPTDNNARRNLRIAQLRQQNQDDKKDNQDNKDNQQNQDQQDKQQDQQDKNQDNEQNQEQQNRDNPENDPKNQDNSPEEPDSRISPQAADQILNAVENNETQTRARHGRNEGEKAAGRASSSRRW